MGLLAARAPAFDLAAWRALPFEQRLEAAARDRAAHGTRLPGAIFASYLLKLAVFAGGAFVIVPLTSNVGGVGSWWAMPIALQKVVVWALLWEILGLGRGSLPLSFRFRPTIGGALYWLQPETVRLPPWPARVPFTAGTRRTAVDVSLYLVVLAGGCVLLGSGGDSLPSWPIWVMLVGLVALGLRDRTAFRAALPELYAVMLVVFLFPAGNLVFALKIVLVAAWWGRAAFGRSAPHALAVAASGAPWLRSTPLAARLWTGPLCPSRTVRFAAHLWTVLLLALPVVLIVARGGRVTDVAVVIMVALLVLDAAAFRTGAALEGSTFLVYATLLLFGHDAGVGAGSLPSPLLMAVLALLLVAALALRGRRETSLWLFGSDGAEQRFDEALVKPAAVVGEQLRRLYDEATAELFLFRSLAGTALQLDGRGLTALLPLAVGDVGRYDVRDGELLAGVALGGRCADYRALLDAVQFECEYRPGELRVITLDAAPLRPRVRRYRILDAADGLLEEGTVRVADLVRRAPWATGHVRVRVTHRAGLPRPVDDLPTGVIKRHEPNAVVAKSRPRPGPGTARPAAAEPPTAAAR